MSRLQKIGMLHIVVAALSIGVFFSLYLLAEPRSAVVWSMAACALLALARRLKGAETVGWDERERQVGHRALLAGYSMLWLFAAMLTGLHLYGVGFERTVPVWHFAWFLIGGAWVMLISRGVALLVLERGPGSRRAKAVVTGLLIVFVAAPAALGGLALLHLSGPEFGGNVESDEWRVTADGLVVARSRIALDRWPGKTLASCVMTITLPYEDAKVMEATLDTDGADVRNLGGARYELAFPEILSWPFESIVEVVWTVPLTTIKATSDPELPGPYRARLRSLIPTHAFRLKIVAEPDSGFKIAGGDGKDWTYLFSNTRGDGGYNTVRGSCSMLIQKIDGENQEPGG